MVLTYRLQLRVGTGTAPASMFRPPRETSNREYSPLESDRAGESTYLGVKAGECAFYGAMSAAQDFCWKR